MEDRVNKTILEWLNELPEPYKTQAISQTDHKTQSSKCSSLRNALLFSFIWMESIEGVDYWCKFTFNHIH